MLTIELVCHRSFYSDLWTRCRVYLNLTRKCDPAENRILILVGITLHAPALTCHENNLSRESRPFLTKYKGPLAVESINY